MTGRHALIVANDEYADPELRRLAAPAQDAAALADALADPALGDFDVRVLHNQSAQETRIAVEDFFADRRPEDLLLLHFSCHGLKNAAGELFLAVSDTRPARLASTAVAADFVNRQMADSRAQRIALFLDCCYGGAFPRGMVVRAAGEAQVRDAFAGQERVGGGRGRVVVTASSAMEYAFEGDRLATGTAAPSVFTGAVVDGLTTGEADKDGDGWVGLTELVGYVTDQVHRTTPHQTPQMWNFGSQGELLIARSRIRKITPTPLPAELLEAMDSPLAAVRFGVVDELRERLHGDDLGQAYAAWQKLGEMTDDDSRKVSDAAKRGLAAATPRPSVEVLDLGAVEVGGVAVAEFQVEGPPLAATAVASAGASWLRVEQQASTVRVTAAPTAPDHSEAEVVIKGPTGERAVPVRVRVPEAAPQRPPEPVAVTPVSEQTAVPEFLVAPTPVSAARPRLSLRPHRVPAKRPGPETTSQAAGATPWWAVAALVLGGLILLYLTWPGEYLGVAWYDGTVGADLQRSRYDAFVVGAVLALVGALGAAAPGRWSRAALGVAGGSAGFLLASGALYMLTKLVVPDAVGTWVAVVVVGAALVAGVLVVARPRIRPFRPAPRVELVVLAAGGLVLGLSRVISHDNSSEFGIWNGVTLAISAGVVAVGWLAIVAGRPATALLLVGAVVAMALLGVVEAVAVAMDDIADFFPLTVGGYLLITVAVGVTARRAVRGDAVEGPVAAPELERTAVPQSAGAVPWWAAAALVVDGALLLVLNWPGLTDSPYAWKHEESGWYVERAWWDAYFLASVVMVLGALAARGAVRRIAWALGVVAGAAVFLFVIGLVYLVAGLSYDADGLWLATVVVAGAVLAVVYAATRPSFGPLWPAPPVSIAVVLGGGALLALSHTISLNENSFLMITHGVSLLAPLVTIGLAWLAVTAPAGSRTQQLMMSATVTAVLLGVPDSVSGWEDLPTAVALVLAGSLLIVAGIATAGPRSGRMAV